MSEKSGKIFVVSGPSGVGKTSLVENAISRLSKEIDISRMITYTTRQSRNGEENGKDYNFVSGQDFEKKVSDNFFLETNKYSGNLYGSPLIDQAELELGKSFIYILDIEGAKRAIKHYRGSTSVWIDPKDLKVLHNRLTKRGSETAKQIEQRIDQAEQEMKEAHKIRLFDYYLVNDDFEQAVNEFMMVVKKAFE